MASIRDSWYKYTRYYSEGFQITLRKESPIYNGDGARATKIADLPRAAVVHVHPIDATNYVPRVKITFDTNKEGWIATPNLNKPGVSTGGKVKVTCDLKPERFVGITGSKMTVKKYYDAVIKAIDLRPDNEVPMVLKNYLKELTEYCINHDPSDRPGLVAAFNELQNSEYIDCMNAVDKDFSEIIAPLCVLDRAEADLASYGFPELNKRNGLIFLPIEGNFPLVDFLIYDDKEREYKFSVKKISGTTNVVKTSDIVNLLSRYDHDQWAVEYRSTPDFKMLEILAGDGVRVGSFKALKFAVETYPSEFPTSVVNGITSMVPADGDPEETVVQEAQDLWLDLAAEYYNEGVTYWREGHPTIQAKGYVSLASLIAQTAIGKLSSVKKKFTYRKVMEEFVMREVVYYKFRTVRGLPEFYMENHLRNRLDPSDNFYLRVKSSIGNPYRDTIGVQP